MPARSVILLMRVYISDLSSVRSELRIQKRIESGFLRSSVYSMCDQLGLMPVLKYLFKQLPTLCWSLGCTFLQIQGSIFLRQSYFCRGDILDTVSLCYLSWARVSQSQIVYTAGGESWISILQRRVYMQQLVPPMTIGILFQSCSFCLIDWQYSQYLFLLYPVSERSSISIMLCLTSFCQSGVALAVIISACRQSCIESQEMISASKAGCCPRARLSLVLPTAVVPTIKMSYFLLFFYILIFLLQIIINKQANLIKLYDKTMDAPPISKEQLDEVYNWVDEIPLSRPKKNITRDFADGVLMAEILHYFFPRLVQKHNYQSANSATQKYNNWNTLNQKVLKKLNLAISKNDIEHIITCTPDAIEKVLRMVQLKIIAYFDRKQKQKQSSQKQLLKNNIHYSSSNDLGKELGEKDNVIKQLRETIDILDLKLKKMDQLNKLKDAKIQTLLSKLQQAGIN